MAPRQHRTARQALTRGHGRYTTTTPRREVSGVSLIRNVKALYEAALDELWALLTKLVMNQGKGGEKNG